jgi:hypothetical protein
VYESAARLAARLDALASALRAAGLRPDRTAHLLETAATAAFDALALEALLEPPVDPAAVEPVRAEPPVRLAA